MNSLSLYHDNDNYIYKIDPITKIIFVISIIAVTYLIPTIPGSLITLLSCVVVLLLAKVLRKTVPLLSVSALVLVSIALIQGLFYGGNKTPLLEIGPVIFYKEGTLYATLLCLRILVIILAFSVLILTTKPSDLVESLVKKGLSPKIGYVLLSVLQIIPQMSATMATITDAQRSRGMETEGSLMTRMKAFIPLMGPVVMSSLTNTRERSMALEVRAFNSTKERTYINEPVFHKSSLFIRIVIILVLIAVSVWRFFLWRG